LLAALPGLPDDGAVTGPRRLTALVLVLVAIGALATASVAATRGVLTNEAAPGAGGPAGSGHPATGQIGADGAGDDYYPTDGNGGYDVAGYQVSISYDPASRHLDGDTTLTARATAPLSRFNLDLYRLIVRSVEVDGRPGEFTQSGEHELVITPAAVIAADATFSVRVRYDGEPRLFGESGLGAGGWYADSTSGTAVAAGEPHSAPAWYPANDTPTDKATFALTARVPDGWTVVSNGVDEPSTSSDGWTTFRWRQREPVATYLTTIAIGRWRVVRSALPDGTPVIDAYASNAEAAREAEQRLPEILEFLSSRFGPYPFEAAGGIFLGASLGYALETQTRPIYPPQGNVEIIVHENAHQWYGNAVSVRRWSDICLNECLASYAQWLWREAKTGANLDQDYRDAVRRVDFRLRLTEMGSGNEFRGVYTKGPMAIHALRRQIGDAAFDTVLKGWVQRHAGGNASWRDFEAYVSEVSGQRLDGFFDAWFRGTDRPAEAFLWPGTLRP
jgi:aminopeptidase N